MNRHRIIKQEEVHDVVGTENVNELHVTIHNNSTTTTNLGMVLPPPIPLPFRSQPPIQQEQQNGGNNTTSSNDIDDGAEEVTFEDAVFPNPNEEYEYQYNTIKHNTTLSTTSFGSESFSSHENDNDNHDDDQDDEMNKSSQQHQHNLFYGDEASLYSIAENSRGEESTTVDNNNDMLNQMTTMKNKGNAVHSSSNHNNSSLSSTPTTGSNGSNGSKGPTDTGNSHTTVPINNVTSFDQRTNIGIELSYAERGKHQQRQIRSNNDDDVITKSSDDQFHYYYHYSQSSKHASILPTTITKYSCAWWSFCNACRTNNTNTNGNSNNTRTLRYQHKKCRILLLLSFILLIGIIFLSASFIIYHTRQQKQVSKSVNSIESDKTNNTTPQRTIVPTLAPAVQIPQHPTSTPISIHEMKYIVSENYVYNAIKTCQGTGTFFDPTTIQGQVFDFLVQEVYNLATVIDSTTTTSAAATTESNNEGSSVQVSSASLSTTTTASNSGIPNFEFASYHTIQYIREKYSLNVFYLYTYGPTKWKYNTNWMTLSNPCHTNTSWYGIECSSSSAIDSRNVTSSSSSTNGNEASCDKSSYNTIIGINLNDNMLSGELPMELCCIPCLQSLNIANNNISGNILWCINEIPTLQSINFDNNPFTIPTNRY
jgi:hypothetical protein